LIIVVGECSFENFVNVGFLSLFVQLGIEALLNDIARELELAESDEVFGDLLEDAFVSFFIFQFEDVLD